MLRRGAILIAAVGVIAYAGCGPFSQATLYTYDGSYDFRGKTVGICLILDADEQQALSDRRIVGRTVSSNVNEGYADEVQSTVQPDPGVVLPPKTVRNLGETMTHSRYYDEELVHPMIRMTVREVERRGYAAKVVPVPDGEVQLRELAESAMREGCDLLAVETVTLVRSWNTQSTYTSRAGDDRTSSLRWQTFVGGMVLTNVTIFDLARDEEGDIAKGRIVWRHSRRDDNAPFLGSVLGVQWDDREAIGEFAARPGLYQAALYRRSAERAVPLLFATLEKGFIPLPSGSNAHDSLRRARTYGRGDEVRVRPTRTSLAWLPATVEHDAGEKVTVRWATGIWHDYARRTQYDKADVVAATGDWPQIVWVRTRSENTFTPYLFKRLGPSGYVECTLTGLPASRTFAPGRVAVALD